MSTLLDLHNVLTILEGHLPRLESATTTITPCPFSIIGIQLGYYPRLPPRYRATFSIAPNIYHPHATPGQPAAICDITLLLYLDGHVLCWDYPPDETLPATVVIGGEPGPLYRSLPTFAFLD